MSLFLVKPEEYYHPSSPTWMKGKAKHGFCYDSALTKSLRVEFHIH